MSNRLLPVSRKELVRRVGRLGFNGPFTGSGHEFMIRGTTRVKLPNPHHGQDVSVDLLAIEVRKEQGAKADYDLFEKINDVPGSSGYQLAWLGAQAGPTAP